jgi:cathepsin A (carboxypeptidase C)
MLARPIIALEIGLNPYDVRRTCDRKKDGDLCYKEMEWIETFMNTPSVKEELGASSKLQFQSCNLQVSSTLSRSKKSSLNDGRLIKHS